MPNVGKALTHLDELNNAIRKFKINYSRSRGFDRGREMAWDEIEAPDALSAKDLFRRKQDDDVSCTRDLDWKIESVEDLEGIPGSNYTSVTTVTPSRSDWDKLKDFYTKLADDPSYRSYVGYTSSDMKTMEALLKSNNSDAVTKYVKINAID